MKKYSLLILTIFSAAFSANAQRYLGLSTGNYLPTKTASLNPALLTSSKLKWSIDIFSFTAGIDQNYGTINSKNLFSNLTNSGTLDINTLDKILIKGSNDKFSLSGGVDVSLLNLYFNVGEKHHFALANRVRTHFNLQDYDASLFTTILGTNNDTTSINVADMRLNTNSWSEFALSYATTIWDNEQSSLSVGLTGKYLSGIAYLGLNVNKLQGSYYVDTLTNKGYINAGAIQLGGSSSFSESSFDGKPLDIVKSMFKGGSSGFGADLGVTYEIKKGQKFKNNYKMRFSAAITDLGSINYKRTTNMTAQGAGLLRTDSISEKFDDINDFRAYLQRQGVNTSFEDKVGTQRISLPSSFVLGVDYNVNDMLFVNATLINGFSPKAIGYSPRTASQFSLTPRFENKLFTVGVPLTYNFYSQSLKAGLGIRVLGLYFGTDDAIAFLPSTGAKGVNFYFGAQVPMAKKKVKVKKDEQQ